MFDYLVFEITEDGYAIATIVNAVDMADAIQKTSVEFDKLYAVRLLGKCPEHQFGPVQGGGDIKKFCRICAEFR